MAINDPKALLARLLTEPSEREWLEFKHNNSDLDVIGRCISACANAAMVAGKDRAFIVWGIENGTKKRLGTTVQLHRLKKGGVNLINWLSQVIQPKLAIEPIEFEDDGKTYSILMIDPAYDQPVQFLDIEYVRVGENVKRLREFPERARALWMATSRHKFEDAVALPSQVDDEILSKLDVDAYYDLVEETKPTKKKEVIRRLAMMGFIKADWEGGYDITNLGAILFAKDVRDFPSIANKSVRVVVYSGFDKSKSEGEVEGRRGYAVGFKGMIKHIMEKLPKGESYPGGVRRTASVYSPTAIREITANALIHQDFTISGTGPVVEIYKDRVEIINPGNSLIDRDRMIDERRSRNEKLARTMRDLGFCEERGGGIDKAIIEIEEMFLPAPFFWTSQDSMRVVIFGPKKFKDLTKEDRTWSCFCHCVVRFMREDFMNNASLRRRFSLTDDDYQTASEIIAATKAQGKIIAADPRQGNKFARYVPYWVR